MAKASDVAKEIITNSILETYEGCSKIVDKKIYVNLRIGGEECQIAISLTAPKTPVDIGVSSLDTAKLRMSAEEYESLGKEVEEKTAAKLKAYKETLSKEEIKQLIEDTKGLSH